MNVSLFVFRILIHKNYLSKLFNAIFQNGWAPRNGHFIVVFLSEVDFRTFKKHDIFYQNMLLCFE